MDDEFIVLIKWPDAETETSLGPLKRPHAVRIADIARKFRPDARVTLKPSKHPETTATTAIVDPREDKLPRWAQRTITRLRQQVSDAQAELQAARTESGPADTDTHLQRGFRADDAALPAGSEIRFTLGGKHHQQYVTARVSREWVDSDLRAVLHLMGGTSLHLLPRASNSVDVVTRD